MTILLCDKSRVLIRANFCSIKFKLNILSRLWLISRCSRLLTPTSNDFGRYWIRLCERDRNSSEGISLMEYSIVIFIWFLAKFSCWRFFSDENALNFKLFHSPYLILLWFFFANKIFIQNSYFNKLKAKIFTQELIVVSWLSLSNNCCRLGIS